MAGIVEAAAIGAMTCTAASTLSLAGYGNAQFCTEGLFTKKPRHLQKHHLEPPHHPTLHDGPLSQTGILVKLNDKSIGSRKIQFNGEILSISADGGAMLRRMALGNCDVRVNGTRVVAVPPPIPAIELDFANQDTAQKWADEFKEASLLGGPEDRIHELILHCLNVEKHLKDLRGRCQSSHEHEKEFKQLKKQMTLSKIGLDEPKRATSSAIAGWFRASIGGDGENVKSREEIAKLNSQLQQEHAELAKQQKIADLLKKGMNKEEQLPELLTARVFQCWALEAHRTTNANLQRLREESKKAQEQVAELQDLLAKLTGQPRLDRKVEPVRPTQQQQQYPASGANFKASAQESAAEPQRASQELDRKPIGGDMQSALPRRNLQGENRSTNMPARRQPGPPPGKEPLKESEEFNGVGKLVVPEVCDDKLSRLSAIEQKIRQRLELRKTAPPAVFSSLEEKMRSRQLQVNEDFDTLQRMFKDHLADQRPLPLAIS